MSAIVEAPYLSTPRSFAPSFGGIEHLNPLKQVQSFIAPTRRQKIIANRRKNFQIKKKTELCKNYILNEPCPLGEKCSFAHGYEELKPRHNASSTFKTIRCKHYHDQMFCQYGPRCQFLHKEKRGEIKAVKIQYTQLLTILEDSYTVKSSNASAQSIEDFLLSYLNLEANRISRLAVFEDLESNSAN